MIDPASGSAAYTHQGHDLVRAAIEAPGLARRLRALLRLAPGADVLDLGCGDGLVGDLVGSHSRYLGIDLSPTGPGGAAPGSPRIVHDLRDGLGPVGGRPFDLYVGTFGIASHLPPASLRGLLGDIARHARPGAVVALEALGVNSLEWPRLWGTDPGPARVLPYRLAADVQVHPWGPRELGGLFEAAGIRPLAARDRTVQAGPKTGESRYWPGLPPLRAALGRLLAGDARDAGVLAAPLPPLPAGPVAALHHRLRLRRAELVAAGERSPAGLAHTVAGLEPCSGGGFGHGLLLVGRVT